MTKRLHSISEIVVVVLLIAIVLAISMFAIGYILGIWGSTTGQALCKIRPVASELRFSPQSGCAVGLLIVRVEGCEARIDRIIIQDIIVADRPNIYPSKILKPGINYIIVYGSVYATFQDSGSAFNFARSLLRIGFCLKEVDETIYKGELIVEGYTPLHILWIPAGPP